MPKFFLLLLVFFSQFSLAEDIYIELMPEATIDRHDVHLSDIAKLTSNDLNLKASLSKLVIVKLDSLGIPFKISKIEIEKVTQERMHMLSGSIVWSNAEFCLVRPELHPVDLSRGVDITAMTLMKNVKVKGVELLSTDTQLPLVAAPRVKIEQRPNFQEARMMGSNITIPLYVFADNRLIAKPALHFRFREVKPNAIQSVGYTFASKEEVYASNLEDSEVDDAKTDAEYIMTPVKKKQFLIQKNQHVKLLIKSGMLEVESQGIAMSNAYLGDQVKVRKLSGSEVLFGRAQEAGVIVLDGG